MTQTLKKNRKLQQDAGREYHQATFDALGLTDVFFDIKAVSHFKGNKVINCFDSQLSKGVDIYCELTDYSNEFIDPKRTLYKIRANQYYDAEYPINLTNAGEQRAVPFEELEIVSVVHQRQQGRMVDNKFQYKPNAELDQKLEEAKLQAEISDSDVPYSQMTIRDRFCMDYLLPKTKYPWLNALIMEAKDEQRFNKN